MDVFRHHEDKGRFGLPERRLDGDGVQQPDGDVDGLAVETPAVAVHLAGVQDGTEPDAQRRVLGRRVVLHQQRGEHRYQVAEEGGLRQVVTRAKQQ
jgi:hypothetical protein